MWWLFFKFHQIVLIWDPLNVYLLIDVIIEKEIKLKQKKRMEVKKMEEEMKKKKEQGMYIDKNLSDIACGGGGMMV